MTEMDKNRYAIPRMGKAELGARLHALQNSPEISAWVHPRESEFQAVLHELEVFQIELEMQNRELRESQQALVESHERYVNLYDFAPVGYLTLDVQGRIQEINLTATGMFGVERRALLGRSVAPWIEPADVVEFRAHLRRCLRNADRTTCALQLKTLENQTIPVELSSTVFLDSQTGETLIRTTIMDLTERRKAEEERDRFFDLSSDLFCSVGLDGYFKRLNPAWEHVLGYTREELLSRPFIDFIHPDDREQASLHFAKLLRGDKIPQGFQNRYVKKDRSIVWLTWSGVISGSKVYGVARDTTQETLEKSTIEHHAASLQEAMTKLDRERKLREEFVSALSHDLRTPLTAARMGVQMLARNAANPAALPRHTSKVIKCIDRMDNMIRDLLDANLIHAGEALPIKRTRFDLSGLVKTTLESLSAVHGSRFIVNAPDRVLGNWGKGHLRRVIENLVGNAVKYGIPDGRITVTVAKLDAKRVSLAVHNLGNPIPLEDHETLFEQFRRSPSAQEGGKRGWGVGLTLVRGIVEAHGGEISVVSNAEAGTTFTVILPI